MTAFSKIGSFVLQKLEESGFEAFFVGGIVRDMLMEKECNDIDITTNALPEEVKRVFGEYNVIETGIKHGTVTVIIDHIPIEITTYRTENSYSDSRHPDSVSFSSSVEDDLSRRDFTVNSMAFNSKTGLVDLYGGKEDLKNRVIRCVGNSEKRFCEDALRILRALRFSSVLGFEIESETAKAAFKYKDKLLNLSAERIAGEVKKILSGINVKDVILKYSDILAVVFPFLKAMNGFDQKNFHHIYDVLEHTAVVVENTPPVPHLRLAAFFHDCAKPFCFSIDKDGTGHFYSHASLGAELALESMKMLKLDNFTTERVYKLVKIHDSPIEASEPAIKRKLAKYGKDVLLDLVALQRADNLGLSPDFRFRQQHYDELEKIIAEVLEKQACFSVRSLKVNGNDMKALGFKGRQIGKALSFLVEAVIDEKVKNEKDELILYIKDNNT